MRLQGPFLGGPDGYAAGYWRRLLHMAARKRPNHGAEEGQLRRRLTALDLTLIGVGATVGSGIFILVGVAVQPTGPAVCLSFLFAACGLVFGGLCFAELAARTPVSGSVYVYTYEAFGEFTALLLGLNVLVDYHFGAALGVVSCSTYLHDALAAELDVDWLPSAKAISLVLVLVLTLTLCCGVERGLKRVNGLLVFVKMSIIVLVMAVGAMKIHPRNLTPFAPFGLRPVLSMAATCTFSFTGFGAVANAAEECVNPRRDVPLGIAASLSICAVLYVAFSLVLCGIVPFREMSPDAPVVDAFSPEHANVPWVGALVDWGAVVGLLTTLLAGLYSQARMYLAMARDGLISSCLGHVNASFGTPIQSQLLCGALAAVLVVTVPLERLVRFLNIGSLSSYSVVCGGVLVLRADQPSAVAAQVAIVAAVSVAASFLLARSAPSVCALLALLVVLSCVPLFCKKYTAPATFACPLCPLFPVLGIALNGYMMSQCHWEAWLRLVLTTVVILLGYMLHAARHMGTGSGSADGTSLRVADVSHS